MFDTRLAYARFASNIQVNYQVAVELCIRGTIECKGAVTTQGAIWCVMNDCLIAFLESHQAATISEKTTSTKQSHGHF